MATFGRPADGPPVLQDGGVRPYCGRTFPGREESLPCAFVPCCSPWPSRCLDWQPVVTIATVAGAAAVLRAARRATPVAAVTLRRPAWCRRWPRRRCQSRPHCKLRKCPWLVRAKKWIARNVPGGNTGADVRPWTDRSRDCTQTRHDAGALPILLKGTASGPPGTFEKPNGFDSTNQDDPRLSPRIGPGTASFSGKTALVVRGGMR
jgi:hypothetical protein